jgi:lipopolysaccharide exporter
MSHATKNDRPPSAAQRSEPARDDQRQIARGVLWLGTATAVSRVLEALGLILVLRFLSREEIGVATLAWSVGVFAECFNGLGIGTAILQQPDLTRRQTSSAFWYSVGVAIVLTVSMVVAAPWIADAYDMPALTPLICAAASKLMFVGVAAVPLALLAKSLRYRALGAVTTSATLASSSITLILAAAGFGAWAPVMGNVANGFAQMVGSWLLCEPFDKREFHWSSLRPVARTGLHLAGSVAVVQLSRNIDYLLLGGLVSAEVLGGYRVAFDLAMAPTVAILQVGNRSALPVYARLQRQLHKLGESWLWTVRTVTLMTVPVLALVFVDGETILTLLGKSGWPNAALTVRLLCVAAWMRGIAETIPAVYVAAGKAHLSLVHSLLNLGLVACALWGALNWFHFDQVLLVAAAWVVATAGLVVVSLAISKRAVALSPARMVRRLLAPAAVLVACAAPAFFVRPWLPEDARLAIVLSVSVVLASYVVALRAIAGVSLRALFKGGARPEGEAEHPRSEQAR